ncbi:hypothetical protein CLV84_2663 [Neolewinella xylanilytica]|uniref:Uncharacterized protein n=1 Tax=Neolewinella xylanilytica TaxID=1514080 RepID=A0A2S6I3K7_9BACT|nr:hypothetical protein [Neolewinella xylanilytica]PPK85757.1 hypothetical protein CLV84_2663 [Neolewinella xylanilytica]
MNNQMLAEYGLSVSEYYEALRQVVDERFQDAPYRELDATVTPAIERMAPEEKDEFFGALAAIAAPFIGKAIGFGAKKVAGIAVQQLRYQVRKVADPRSRVSHLLKLINDPRLKRLLAGNLLNRVSPKGPIGRQRIRHVRQRAGKQEFTEVNLSEYVNLFNLLAGPATSTRTADQRTSSIGNESAETGQGSLEASLQKLYGPELVVQESSDTSSGFQSKSDFGVGNSSEAALWGDEFAYDESIYF